MRTIARIAVTLVAVLAAPSLKAAATTGTYDGRPLIVYEPSHLPPAGARSLVVVLHGGLGNASHIENGGAERGLNLDAVAERQGFIVAYLNGTKVARLLSADARGWNAGGGCCGLPYRNGLDDVGYIRGAVDDLAARYGIDPARVYAIGHSNGAMMALRVVCEAGVFAAVIPVSGTLNLDGDSCPGARGRRVLAIHGEDDQNVPIGGGRGSKGVSGVAFQSEAHSQRVLQGAGASVELLVLPGVDHGLRHIDAAIQAREGRTLAEKAARYFGLAP